MTRLLAKPVRRYIDRYIYKKLPKIVFFGLVKGFSELLALSIVLVYLNLFMSLDIRMPLDFDLTSAPVMVASLLILILTAIVTNYVNVFMFSECAKISEQHGRNISNSLIRLSFLKSSPEKVKNSAFSKSKVLSMACNETHRLNQNINIPTIQVIFSLITILMIISAMLWQFGWYVATVMALFLCAGYGVKLLIVPVMNYGSKLQKEGYREYLKNYTYFSDSAFSILVSKAKSSFINRLDQSFKKHNKGFTLNQTSSLNIKLAFETVIFLSIVIFVFIDNTYGLSEELKSFLVANALASLKILPSAVQVARNMSQLNSDTKLVDEHNQFLSTYLDNDLNFKDDGVTIAKLMSLNKPVIIYGPSGGGKSVLARSLARQYFNQGRLVQFLDSDPSFDPMIVLKKVGVALDKKILKAFDLQNIKEREFASTELMFSRGQLQRLKLALTLSEGVDVLILDEALNGVGVLLEHDILKFLEDYVEKHSIKLFTISHSKEIYEGNSLDYFKERISVRPID